MKKATRKTFLSSISAVAILATCLCSNAAAQQRSEGWQSRNALIGGDASVSDSHFISTWITNNFTTDQGGSQIYWNEGNNPDTVFDWVWFSYGQGKQETGYDIGLGRTTSSKQVADLATQNDNGWTSPAYNRTVKYNFTHELKPSENASFWWMGPKTIIYSYPEWQDNPEPNNDRLSGQYEVYIVTDSNISRNDLASRANLQYAGGAWYGQGASRDFYHHYTTTLPFQGVNGQTKYIFQVWTIKQTYMSDVEVPVNHIQRGWMVDGLVPWHYYNLGWKLNLETSGRFASGWGNFEGTSIPSNDF